MPTVKLKINGLLYEGKDRRWAHPEALSVPISEGESLLTMIRRLAADDTAFRKCVYEQDEPEFGTNILVLLNGMLVNPHDPSETLLKDGDEVMLMPVVSGGSRHG